MQMEKLSTEPTSDYELIIKPRKHIDLGISELLQYKELFFFFTWRDIKVKYKQTVMGFAWAVIQPLMMTIIFSVFFGRALNVPSDNLPYPIFVMAGLLLWNIFSTGLSAAANSMVTNANIIKKIYFPRLIIPLSSILVSLFDFAMALIVFVGMLWWYDVHANWLAVAGAMVLSTIMVTVGTFGPGCLLSALNVKYRDFRYIIPFLVQVLLFITPVIYPVSMMKHELLKYLLALNPMTGAIILFRSALTGVPADLHLVGISCISAFVFFVLGVYYFRSTEAYFADLA